MAIFHHSIKIISRGNGGKSAVAAAAYRAGEKILCEYDGRISDYTKKSGIVHNIILLPDNAPPEYTDRAILWNAVEKIEKAKNSQLAREIEIALPVELTLAQHKRILYDYVNINFVKHGMCADIAIHDKGDGNPHAHIMLTMRPFNEDGSWGAKQQKEYILNDSGEKIYDPKKRQYKCKSVPTTDWNEQTKAEEWRAAWANTVNNTMIILKHPARVDHRSYERQGLIFDQIPTVHLGVAASQMQRRAISTERSKLNHEIGVTNKNLRQLKTRMIQLQYWLKEEVENTKQPNLADVISNMLANSSASQYEKIAKLKAAAKMFSFLQQNNIMEVADLDEKLKSMIHRQFDITSELKPINRRLDTLAEHIRQSENYFGYKNIYNEYQKLKTRKQPKFYEAHKQEIRLYESAKAYLSDVMNGKTKIPTESWRKELRDKTAEKGRLNQEYAALKDETTNVERIRKSVYDIMNPRSEAREMQKAQPVISKPKPKKSRCMER